MYVDMSTFFIQGTQTHTLLSFLRQSNIGLNSNNLALLLDFSMNIERFLELFTWMKDMSKDISMYT